MKEYLMAGKGSQEKKSLCLSAMCTDSGSENECQVQHEGGFAFTR